MGRCLECKQYEPKQLWCKLRNDGMLNDEECMNWKSRYRVILILRMRIEAMRKRLHHLAEKYGRHHPLVLAMSRRLDGLVVEYMRKIGKARVRKDETWSISSTARCIRQCLQ